MLENRMVLTPISDIADYKKIVIGNSVFSEDIWDLTPLMQMRTTSDCHKKISFAYIPEGMKQIVKLYAYYKLGKVKPQTVKSYINGSLPKFFEYCLINEITSFTEISRKILFDFSVWQREVKKNSPTTGYTVSHVINDIIKAGQIMGWEVPNADVTVGMDAAVLWEVKQDRSKRKVKPIPEGVLAQILENAVNKETDVITKAGIIIQSQTGLRINEVLSIRTGCVHTSNEGYDYMKVHLGKTEKGESIVHKVFINNLVKDVIVELEKHTKDLRKESGLQELFLEITSKSKRKISVVNTHTYTPSKLATFIKRWDIRDNNGELYPLKSHQFRATFVREMVKQKVPIEHVMRQFSHVSVEMTCHYLTLQEEEIKDIYSQMLLSPEAKIAGIKADSISNKLNALFKGRTEAEITDIVENLAKTMSFNPLPNGICLYDYRRGNCSDGDGCFFYNCPNFVTEISFLPVLKKELELMELQMKRSKELGMDRQYQREFVKYRYLKPLVS
jgi:integrase